MKGKTILLFLLLIIILSAVVPLHVYAINRDYMGHWAEDTIQKWLDNNYVTGYPDGSFKPDGSVTRAEFVKMVNNLLGYTETTNINFIDISPEDWFYPEVQKAFKAGYIAGVSETQFAPNNNLTREQAAVIVSKIMGLDLNPENVQVFSDYDSISNWARAYVNASAEAQLILGYGYTEDNSFRPQKPITRAEAIVLLDRMNQTIIENANIPESTIELPPTGGGGGGGGGIPITSDPIKISWTDPSGNKFVGDKQNIIINMSLSEDVDSVTNVSINMKWEKLIDTEWKATDEGDISITYNLKDVEMVNGIFQPVKGTTVNNDTSITIGVTFNNVGQYKLTVYCIKE